ncbi:MAG TPA: carboxypeptidase-like regulatory domain-containing protein [Vicinamibacterales bacterium]|nr:carboxypeptidase-like regulatory domain-containing protein [Vicinamibacterales bacterium]
MNPNSARYLAIVVPALLALMTLQSGCNRGPTGPELPIRAATPPPTSTDAPTFEVSLSGPVADNIGRPLADARVEVIDGQRRGVFALTDSSGNYALPGAFSGSVTLRASKAGYLAATQTFFGGRPGENIFGFRLQTQSSVTLLGTYTLTITADPVCAALPLEARSRTYEATAAPAPNSPNIYLLTLSGATFSFSFSRVIAAVAGDFVSLHFDSDIDAGPLTEELGGATTISFLGQASGLFDGRSISAPFSGELVYRSANAPQIQCTSSAHTLTLARP